MNKLNKIGGLTAYLFWIMVGMIIGGYIVYTFLK